MAGDRCLFIPSPTREGSTLFGDHRVCVHSNLYKFQHKVLWARRKQTLNMGEFRVAQLIALVIESTCLYVVYFMV